MQVSIKRHQGLLHVDINGQLFAPLSFKSFRPNPQNVSEFHKAGVRLFTVLSSGIICALGVPYSRYGESWVGNDQYDFSAIDRQMDMFIENAPEGYFAPMFQLDTRPWYLDEHPEIPNTFTHLSQAAYHEHWRRAAAEYLKAAIRHCEEKYGERIYGYFMLCGQTTEWFSAFDREASHPIKEKAYGKPLPTLAEFDREGDFFLGADEESVREARRFHADTVGDLALYFAAEAQSVIQHRKLLGLYYGYLFELSGDRVYNFGHLGYEKVYLSPDIDMISSPSAYEYRKIGDPSAFMVTQKTLDKHNKLYFLEFDHITHVAPPSISEPNSNDVSGNAHMAKIPGANSKCKDEAETLNLMYRDFVLCYAHGAALWWFDMFDGWFRSPGMMGAIESMINLHKERADKPKESIAQIAVFAQGESMYHTRKKAHLNTLCLSDMRQSLAEMGAPYEIFSIADLFNCDPKEYKLCILLNAYDIPQEQMDVLRAWQASGVTILWMYAPDYAPENDVQRICEATGIRVVETDQPHGAAVGPYFAIEDDEAEIIAPQVAKKGLSVYASEPFVNSAALREVIRRCGIHLYSQNPQVYTYVNRDAVGVYNATDGDATVYLPEDGEYTDCLTGEKFECKDGKVVLPLRTLKAYLLVK